MKNSIKITFSLLAMILLLTACSKDDDTQYNKIKTLSGMVVTDDDGIQSNISYKYDTQGRLTEISIDNPYIVIFEFTYRADGRIEKIRRSDGQGFIDFTYSYSGNSIIPDRLKYSGAVPTYTSDVVYTNNSLFFNDEAGKEYAIEGVNAEKNTYSSIMLNGKIVTFHFAPQLKNGLENQSALNIPLSMTMTYFLTYQLYGGLPLYSQVITGYESSDGEQLKWQYETDAAGYIIKIKNRKTEYRYQ